MKHFNFKFSLLFFCALLSLAACQKIYDEDILLSDNANKTTSKPSSDDDDDDSGNETDDNDGIKKLQLQELPDGTLLFPSNEHVIFRKPDENSGSLTYISLYEWDDVPSGYYAENPDAAEDIAARYVEGDVSGWRLPTRGEAAEIRNTYCRKYTESNDYDDNLLRLNEQITAAGGRELKSWAKKDGTGSYRYLCERALYSFSLKEGTSISKCGEKTRYHLRLVKDVPKFK